MDNKNFPNLMKLKGEYKISRLAIMGLLITNLTLVGFIVYTVASKENLPNKMMVLDSKGNIFNAELKDLSIEDYKAEAKGHISAFIRLVYENDQFSYKRNMKLCRDLCDNDISKSVTEEQEELEIYDKMVKFNLRTTIEISLDSISLDNSLNGTIKFKQNVIRDEKIQTIYSRAIGFSIIKTGLQRSEKNPHAMLVSKFKLLSIGKFQTQ